MHKPGASGAQGRKRSLKFGPAPKRRIHLARQTRRQRALRLL
jgi:hypothetical protein